MHFHDNNAQRVLNGTHYLVTWPRIPHFSLYTFLCKMTQRSRGLAHHSTSQQAQWTLPGQTYLFDFQTTLMSYLSHNAQYTCALPRYTLKTGSETCRRHLPQQTLLFTLHLHSDDNLVPAASCLPQRRGKSPQSISSRELSWAGLWCLWRLFKVPKNSLSVRMTYWSLPTPGQVSNAVVSVTYHRSGR